MMDTYTRTLELAAESGDKKVAEAAVTKLVAHLKATGKLKLLPTVAAELRKIAARRKALAPVVEVAHQKDAAGALAAAKAEGIEAKEAKVNPSLISGWRARKGGSLIDRSGKRTLIDIYKKVTS